MIMWIGILAVMLASFYLLVKYLWHAWTDSFRLSWMPWTPSLPFLGYAPWIQSDPHDLFKQIRGLFDEYGDVYCLWLGWKPLVFISDVKLYKDILHSQRIVTKSFHYDYLQPWLNTGLLTSTGAKWKTRRRLLTPSFHFSILNDFVDVFNEQSMVLVEKFRKTSNTGVAVELQKMISLAILDVITETSMGVKMDYQTSEHSTYVQAIEEINVEVQHRQKTPWLWSDWVYPLTSRGRDFYKNVKITHDLTLKVINERINARLQEDISKPKSDKKKFFLDLLLDIYDRSEIDIEGIKEEVTTFMFEGHDTTASGLGFVLWELSQHPDVQEKLHQEIDEVEGLAKHGESILAKLKRCTYLEQVLKESLRLHPPVPGYARLVEEDVVIDGHLFRRGVELTLPVYCLHRNPKYWPNPDAFMPERFAPEETAKRNPYAFAAFSAGPRNCIGQKFAMNNEKIMLYKIMLNYRLEACEEKVPMVTVDIVMKSKNGLWVKFYTR